MKWVKFVCGVWLVMVLVSLICLLLYAVIEDGTARASVGFLVGAICGGGYTAWACERWDLF